MKLLLMNESEYEFMRLAPCEYTLEATAEGFKTSSKNIAVRAGETSVENIKLEVADVTATVTSSNSGQGVQTSETAPAPTIKQTDLQTLPIPNEQLLDALPSHSVVQLRKTNYGSCNHSHIDLCARRSRVCHD